MPILRDIDIYKLVQVDKKLVSSGLTGKEATYGDKDSPIQPSSLDLRVGDIYVPDENPGRRYVRPTSSNEHIVKPGETVVVTTQEVLDLPKDIAAIGFPPSSMAVNGILMTNPGHIDPGYKGRMHLTMINMGRQDYGLRRGDPVATLLLFRLNQEVEVDYQSRLEKAKVNPTSLGERKRILDVLRNLAPDFMDFKNRAGKIAKAEIVKSAKWLTVLTSIFTAIAAIIIGYLEYKTANSQSDLRARVTILEANPMFEEKLEELKETDLVKLEERLKQLEGHLATNNPAELR